MNEDICPKKESCSNHRVKCNYCVNLNCYKPGKSMGKGQRHEKKIQSIRLRPGSGSIPGSKGDLIDSQALYEAKSGYTTINAKGQSSFSLQRAWLTKIEDEAIQEGKLPILAIHFDNSPDDEIWTVVRGTVLFDLLDRIKELEGDNSATFNR